MSESLFEWIGDPPLPVTVRFSRRARRLRLQVKRDGRAEVVLPNGAPKRLVRPFVEAHRDWLEGAMAGVLRRRQAAAQRPETIALPALGESWTVRDRSISPAAPWRVLGGDTVEVAEGAWQAGLDGWLRSRAKATLPAWLAQVAAMTGLGYTGVTIRTQKSRWGSCTARGRISLNDRLLFMPPAVVRYLLVHELAHTVYMNHSPAFWALVGKLEPDYQALDPVLRKGSEWVPAWADPGLR